MTGHVHARLMAQYAEDAAAHENVWELWEFKAKFYEKWHSFQDGCNPTWKPETQYT